MADHDTAVYNVAYLVGTVMNLANSLINDSVAAGKRLPITELSQTISDKLIADGCSVDKVFCYHVISKYIKARNYKIKMGPNGGIEVC